MSARRTCGDTSALLRLSVKSPCLTGSASNTDYNWARSVFASLRSAVSNPSVNQSETGASNSRASALFLCPYHSRARLVAARSSQDLACCCWTTSIAWWKDVSASGWLSGDCCKRSSPHSRYSSASYQRSPILSATASYPGHRGYLWAFGARWKQSRSG